jgi:hypothetical protein
VCEHCGHDGGGVRASKGGNHQSHRGQRNRARGVTWLPPGAALPQLRPLIFARRLRETTRGRPPRCGRCRGLPEGFNRHVPSAPLGSGAVALHPPLRVWPAESAWGGCSFPTAVERLRDAGGSALSTPGMNGAVQTWMRRRPRNPGARGSSHDPVNSLGDIRRRYGRDGWLSWWLDQGNQIVLGRPDGERDAWSF